MNETNFDQVHAQCAINQECSNKLQANSARNFASKQLGTTGSRVTVRNESTLAQRNSHFSWVYM